MGSLFKPKGGSTTTQTSAPWEPAQGALKDILAGTGDWYKKAQEAGYISPTGDLSGIYKDYLGSLQQMSGQLKPGIENIWGQGMGSLGQAGGIYGQAASGGMAITPDQINQMAGQFMDEGLLQQNIDAATRPITRQLTEQALPGIDRSAVASGGMGSSRAGIAAGVAQRGAEEAAMDTASRMRMQAQQDALNRAQGIASGNIQQQMAGAGGLAGIGGQQLGAAGQYGNVMMGGLAPMLDAAKLQAMLQGQGQADLIGQRDYMYDILTKYGNIAQGIGGMGSTGTSTKPGTSMFDKILGGGQVAGGIMSMFSDETLKKNIKTTGKADVGGEEVRTASWEWNDKAKNKYGLVGKDEGVIAQEVAMKAPEAVKRAPTGDLMVDYSQVNVRRVKRSKGRK